MGKETTEGTEMDCRQQTADRWVGGIDKLVCPCSIALSAIKGLRKDNR